VGLLSVAMLIVNSDTVRGFDIISGPPRCYIPILASGVPAGLSGLRRFRDGRMKRRCAYSE
jgi:hypothetical protein